MKKPPSTTAHDPERPSPRRGAWRRLGLLAGSVVAAFVVVASSGSLSADRVRDWVDGFGPSRRSCSSAVGGAHLRVVPRPAARGRRPGCCSAPRRLPDLLCAATLGAVCAFTIARHAGYEAVEELAGPRAAVAARPGRPPWLLLRALRAPRARPADHTINYVARADPDRASRLRGRDRARRRAAGVRLRGAGRLVRRPRATRRGDRPRGDGASASLRGRLAPVLAATEFALRRPGRRGGAESRSPPGRLPAAAASACRTGGRR